MVSTPFLLRLPLWLLVLLSRTQLGSGVNVGVGVTRLSASGENIDLLKNAPLPQGSALEFMQGNKVVLQAGDCVRVNSDTNTSVDAPLTIMEIT